MLRASCHCGAVVLEIARRPRKLTQCNCSICRRYGALWAYCSRSGARLVQGRRSLVKYTQEGRTREFWRCKICGCVTHHQRPRGTGIAVNARTMDPQTVADVPIRTCTSSLVSNASLRIDPYKHTYATRGNP